MIVASQYKIKLLSRLAFMLGTVGAASATSTYNSVVEWCNCQCYHDNLEAIEMRQFIVKRENVVAFSIFPFSVMFIVQPALFLSIPNVVDVLKSWFVILLFISQVIVAMFMLYEMCRSMLRMFNEGTLWSEIKSMLFA
jgi:hypothetical protein